MYNIVAFMKVISKKRKRKAQRNSSDGAVVKNHVHCDVEGICSDAIYVPTVCSFLPQLILYPAIFPLLTRGVGHPTAFLSSLFLLWGSLSVPDLFAGGWRLWVIIPFLLIYFYFKALRWLHFS